MKNKKGKKTRSSLVLKSDGVYVNGQWVGPLTNLKKRRFVDLVVSK